MTEKMMYGFTYEQWMDPDRLAKKAQEEWDNFFRLQNAFELVQNKDHWKGPIDATIPIERLEDVREAVASYAGSRGFKAVALGNGQVRVTAPGYWGNGF